MSIKYCPSIPTPILYLRAESWRLFPQNSHQTASPVSENLSSLPLPESFSQLPQRPIAVNVYPLTVCSTALLVLPLQSFTVTTAW